MYGSEEKSSWQQWSAHSDFPQVVEASVGVGKFQGIIAPDYYSTLYPEIEEDPPQFEDNDELMVIPKRFKSVFYDSDANNEFAGMANPRPDFIIDSDQSSGLLVVDCGATTTLTDSLFNMTDVKPKVITIQLAGDGATIQSSYIGKKTYYIPDVTGTVRPVTTRAFYVKDLKHDLLGGRALVNADNRVILDKDPTVAGVYPVTKGEIDPTTKFEFIGTKGLFYLRTMPISVTKYANMSGYCLWHRRLIHVPNRTLQLTIPHSKGLQELESKKFNADDKCPACMVGKAHLEPYPDRKERATNPLGRVYVDIFSSSVISIEGYRYALLIVDDASDHKWVYGLKTKDDTLAAL